MTGLHTGCAQARDKKLALEDLSGGTFTISNGVRFEMSACDLLQSVCTNAELYAWHEFLFVVVCAGYLRQLDGNSYYQSTPGQPKL